MKILIIGAGYVGKAAASAWKAQGHTLTLTTRFSTRMAELAPFAHRVILIEHLPEALLGQDIVLLSVAPDSTEESDYEQTYLGTAKALLQHLDASTRQILYTSSSSVYGEHGGALVDESTVLKPISRKETILIETENLLQMASCKVCILRLGEIIGPGRRIVDRLHALNGRTLAGTGENITNLSPIEEIVKALTAAVAGEWEGIYNICNDLHIPRRMLYNQICQEEGIPPVSWDASRLSPHSGNKTVSNAKYKGII